MEKDKQRRVILWILGIAFLIVVVLFLLFRKKKAPVQTIVPTPVPVTASYSSSSSYSPPVINPPEVDNMVEFDPQEFNNQEFY